MKISDSILEQSPKMKKTTANLQKFNHTILESSLSVNRNTDAQFGYLTQRSDAPSKGIEEEIKSIEEEFKHGHVDDDSSIDGNDNNLHIDVPKKVPIIEIAEDSPTLPS